MVLRRRRTRIGERVIHVHEIDQITIAAWNGAAMGGGACIATALDFRVGADDCFMQYPEIEIGLNLMWQSLPLCTRLVGASRAKRLVAGGERVFAPTLLQWGALDELVPRAELMERALAMAEHYAAKPPIAVQMIKRSVNAIEAALDRSLMHMDADQNLLTQATEDRRTAAATYRTAEKPVFKGD
jgi:enoyl-CoA hydratase/carnithine racemase